MDLVKDVTGNLMYTDRIMVTMILRTSTWYDLPILHLPSCIIDYPCSMTLLGYPVLIATSVVTGKETVRTV